MSTALDHEFERAEREAASVVRPQGPKRRGEDPPAAPPTSARAWKRDLPEPHTLPSGNVAILQRPQMTELIKEGRVPNPLLSAALGMTQGVMPDEMADVVELLDVLIAAAFVEPRISLEDEHDPDELSISVLSDADRNYVLIWAQQGVAGLRRFRLDEVGPRGGGDGGDLRDAAE